MVAKDKQDFLFQLHNELHRIGVDADEDIFADFEEHFKASQNEGFSEEETCERLGDVKEIARNYIDIEDERLNSIVARAIESDIPHVSLTKPGRTESADASLNSKRVELDKSKLNAEENSEPIREYTPEHIKEEPQPDPLSIPSMFIAKEEEPAEPAREFTPEHIAAEPEAPKNTAAEESTGAPTGQGAAIGAAIGAAVEEAVKAVSNGIKGSVSKETGDEIKAAFKEAGSEIKDAFSEIERDIKDIEKDIKDVEKEINDDVAAANEDFSNSHKSDIPPQCCEQVGSGGFKFSDVKDMKINVNWGKLIMWILLDVFIFVWALPALASVIIAFATGIGIAPIASGVGIIFGGFDGIFAFHRLSEIFLGIGVTAFGCMMTGLAANMVKGFIIICKNIIMGHVKALFDL